MQILSNNTIFFLQTFSMGMIYILVENYFSFFTPSSPPEGLLPFQLESYTPTIGRLTQPILILIPHIILFFISLY
ncbi:hypothetical protein F5X96DRAFT_632905, partial [Biscogniauxia mediterranea]